MPLKIQKMNLIYDSNKPISNLEFKLDRRYDEKNLSAEIYHRLKLLGIESHLEYRYEKSIFDLVVLNDSNHIQFIFEVKSLEHRKNAKLNTKQLAKYSQYNIPIIYIHKFDQIDEAIEYIKTKTNTNDKIKL